MPITPSTYDKALMGRINAGTGLLGKEKTIAKRVPPDKTNIHPYSWERISTNPIARGVGAAALGAGVLYGYKKSVPIFQKMRDVQQVYLKTPPGKVNKLVLDFLDKFPNTLREKAIITEERIARIKGVSNKTIASVAASSGLSSAATSYLHRQRHANDLLDQGKDPVRSYIRTKLAEKIPAAVIDDAALYLTKAIQLMEEQKKPQSPVTTKPNDIVKKELAAIEKKAFPTEQMKQVGKAIAYTAKHPIHSAVQASDKAKRITDKVAPGAWDFVKSVGANPGAPPGSSEVAIATQAIHHTAKHLGKGVDAAIQKSKPFLSRAKDEVRSMWAEAKVGPK